MNEGAPPKASSTTASPCVGTTKASWRRIVHFGGLIQETTRVLTEAAVRGMQDDLRG